MYFCMPPRTYTLTPGQGVEASLARFSPAQLSFMCAHNLIRVLERPATDAPEVRRAASALAAWRRHARDRLQARARLAAALARWATDAAKSPTTAKVLAAWRRHARGRLPARARLAAAYSPEDRAQARRLLRQYRAARGMHMRLRQRRLHLLYHCFRALSAPVHAACLLAARAALRQFRLAARVHKRLAWLHLRAMCGPFRALDMLRRMARWVPRLLIVWREWVCGCARQRRARLLVAAEDSPLFLRRHGRAWTLPSGVRRRAPCTGCGL